ncbi:MAG TPA: hypothetical protein VMU95_07395 [Trebonia sp.]|nr:hypothetical protein [Trebonia sp.]
MLVPVVIVVAILAVLAAVVFVAAGGGGEMPAAERTDYAPLEMGPVSATDVVLLRPPTALWGYSQQATDEALEQIADSIRERDVRIVALEQLVTDLGRQPVPSMPVGSPYTGARHARPGSEAGGAPATATQTISPQPLGAPVDPAPWDLSAGPAALPEISHE